MNDPIYAGLATLPERWEHLPRVLEHILPHVDFLTIFVDAPAEPPWLLPDALDTHPNWGSWVTPDEKTGDTGKFYGHFAHAPESHYYLALDDDIFYPPDYVKALVWWVDEYERRALVGTGGAIVHEDCKSYHADSRSLSLKFNNDVPVPVPVNLLNTGQVAFHTDAVRLRREDFPHPNMTDVWLAAWAQKRKVPMVVIPHSRSWIEAAPLGDLPTIFKARKGNDAEETAVIHSLKWEVARP
jgi:hypothetical protein